MKENTHMRYRAYLQSRSRLGVLFSFRILYSFTLIMTDPLHLTDTKPLGFHGLKSIDFYTFSSFLSKNKVEETKARQIILKNIDLPFYGMFLAVSDDFNIIMAHLFDNFSCVSLVSHTLVSKPMYDSHRKSRTKNFCISKKETIDGNQTRTQIIFYSLSKFSHVFFSIFFCFFRSFCSELDRGCVVCNVC